VLVGTVAVFRPAKRLDRWLSVARRVREREPRVRFVLVGYGPLEGDVREWVRANGLEDVVHLAGAQTDVRPWMSALDVYMMSSDFEGLPVALLEAMAMGVPVLTTSVGGIPEVVEHEQCGMLVGVDDPERGLVDLLLRMVSDRSLRERLGRAARERVEQRFGMQRMVREIQDVYDRALARG
jgi:glycosyltransferase involved in cell wall biosynthesis